jgi:hypothetical protein
MATTNSQTIIPSQQAATLVSSLSKIAEGFSFFKKKATNADLRGKPAKNIFGAISHHIPQIKTAFQQSQSKTTDQNGDQSDKNNNTTNKNSTKNSTIRGSIKQTVKEHITGGIKGLKSKYGTKEGLLGVASAAAGGGILSSILKESSDKISESKSTDARKEKFISRYLAKTEKGQELSSNLSGDDARAEALKVYEKEIELIEKINKLEDEHKKLKSEGLEITEEELEHVKNLEKQKADLISGKKQTDQPVAANKSSTTDFKNSNSEQKQENALNANQSTEQSHVSNKSIAATNKQSRKTQKALQRAASIQKSASKILKPETASVSKEESKSEDTQKDSKNLLQKIYSAISLSNKELKNLGNYSKLQLTSTSKRPGFLNTVSNFASSAKEKGGSLLSSAMSAGSNIASAAKEKGGSLISSAAGSGIGRAASSVASRFALPALAVAGAGAAGWGVGSMISDALPNLGSDIYDFVHGEPKKEKPYQLDPEKIAARKKKDADAARSNFAKTDPRIVKPEEVQTPTPVKTEEVKVQPQVPAPQPVKPEEVQTPTPVKTEEVKVQPQAVEPIAVPVPTPSTPVNTSPKPRSKFDQITNTSSFRWKGVTPDVPRVVKPEVTPRESQTTQLEKSTADVEQAKQQTMQPIINVPASSPTTIVNNNTTVTGNRPDIRLQEPTYTQVLSSAFRRNPYLPF